MKRCDLTIVHAPNVLVELAKECSIYCPLDQVYIVPHRDIETELKSIDSFKKETEFYKNRYENVLKGLNYWKHRVNEKI